MGHTSGTDEGQVQDLLWKGRHESGGAPLYLGLDCGTPVRFNSVLMLMA